MAASDFGVAQLEFFLKAQFKKGAVEDMTLKQGPLFGLMGKDDTFGGEYLKIPLKYGGVVSGSADFATAKAMSGGISGVAFKIESENLKEDYTMFAITGKALRVGKTNEKAFFQTLTSLVESSYLTQTQRVCKQMFRNTIGYFGEVSSIGPTNDDITLTNRADSRMIEVGQRIGVLNDAVGGTYLDYCNGGTAASAYITVESINRSTGVVTFTTDVNTTFSTLNATAGDLLIHYGDRGVYSDEANSCIHGMEDWVPRRDGTQYVTHHQIWPSTGNLFGVDRTSDTERLAGLTLDGGGAQKQMSALLEGISLLCEVGANPTHIFMDPVQFRKCRALIQEKTIYHAEPVKKQALKADGSKSATVYYSGFQIDGDKGPVSVFSDIWCPPNTAWVISMENWKLHSAGECIGMLMEDDLRILRESDSDGYEGRVGGYREMSCDAPGHQLQIYNFGS